MRFLFLLVLFFSLLPQGVVAQGRVLSYVDFSCSSVYPSVTVYAGPTNGECVTIPSIIDPTQGVTSYTVTLYCPDTGFPTFRAFMNNPTCDVNLLSIPAAANTTAAAAIAFNAPNPYIGAITLATPGACTLPDRNPRGQLPYGTGGFRLYCSDPFVSTGASSPRHNPTETMGGIVVTIGLVLLLNMFPL